MVSSVSWLVRALPLLAVAAVVTVAPVAAGVFFATPHEAPPPATRPLATELTTLDTTTLALARQPFCDRVAGADVKTALGQAPESADTWDNGSPVRLPDGSSDVAHEHGCRWTAESGASAAAWVFAPPVTEQTAARLVQSATRTAGCTPLAGAAAYGAPSVALSCPAGTAGLTTVSYRGLFGDAWLVCELTTAQPDADRAGRWCAGVALAARGG